MLGMQLLVFAVLFKFTANSIESTDGPEGSREMRKCREEITTLLDFLQMMAGHLDLSDQTLQLTLLAPVFERLVATQAFSGLFKSLRLICIDKNLIALDKRLKALAEPHPLAGQARNPEPLPQPALCGPDNDRSAETNFMSPIMPLKAINSLSQFNPTPTTTFQSFLTTKDSLSNLNSASGKK